MLKRFGLVFVLMTCLLLTSCSLLPEEETFSTKPVVHEYEPEAYTFTTVIRNDMQLSRRINCNYVPLQSVDLKFPVGGIQYDEVFVQVGDTVSAGQLLAQLKLDGAEDYVESCKRTLEKLQLRLVALEENYTLNRERQLQLLRWALKEDREEALSAIDQQYIWDREQLLDEIHIQELYLAEYESQLADRQLYAPFDGAITYIRDYREGDTAVAGDRFITIADASLSLFRLSTEYWNLFQPGDEYIIKVAMNEYEAIVASEEELGLPVTEKNIGDKCYVYLKLKYPAFDLEGGDLGSLNLVLESRENVLTLNKNAVSSINGEPIVYYTDENGVRTYKFVEIGLETSNMVEIISGVVENERVIVY